MNTVKKYDGKIGPRIMISTQGMIKKYHSFKRITRDHNGPYAEDTDRYSLALRWYELIRETLEEWRQYCPNDAKVVEMVLGLGTHIRPASATKTAQECHYSQTTVYTLRKAFVMEIAFKAIRDKLLYL